jgi:glycosyltransferase EpsH
VNDGSTDGSLAVLEEYAQKDSRITIINQENQGVGIARNSGLKVAKGEYIGFVDPDDWIVSDMYEKMYQQALDLDSEIVICDYVYHFDKDGQEKLPNFFLKAETCFQSRAISMPEKQNLSKEELYPTLLVSPCYVWNRVYKREFLEKYGLFFSDRKCFEDCPFILKTHILATKVSYLKYRAYYYRIRSNSLCHGYQKRYVELFNTMDEFRNFLQEQKLLEIFEQNLRYFCIIHPCWIYPQVAAQYKKEFRKLAEIHLTPYEYSQFLKYLKLRIRDKFSKLLSFSVFDDEIGKKCKVYFLGFKMSFKCKKYGSSSL